jgi:RNA polymerase sigma factor (sigma-70 family)
LNLASNRRRSWRMWRYIGIDAASAEASAAPSSEAALATAQTRQRVRVAIEALPERLREVILLTEYSELTHQEIGKALGIPAGTVGSRRNTAIAQLSEQLGEVEGLA